MTKIAKNAKVSILGGPPGAPPGPEKKASLSNRRIGTRNHVFYMVSIQKGQKSTPPDRACARPPKKGRIKAKLKFFFELFQKTSKIAFLTPNFAFLRPFLAFFCLFRPLRQNRHFEPFLAHFSHFFKTAVNSKEISFLSIFSQICYFLCISRI